MQTYQVRIEPEVLKKARDHCIKNGMKLTWFVSRAIEKELRDIADPLQVDWKLSIKDKK